MNKVKVEKKSAESILEEETAMEEIFAALGGM